MNKIEELIEQLCPEGVKFKEFGDVISALRTGLNPRQNFKLNLPDAKNYYITVRELNGFSVKITEKTDRVDTIGLSLIQNRSKIQKGDILLSGTGTIGRTALVSEIPSNWNVKEGIYVITPIVELINAQFLIYLIQSDQMHNQILAKADGSTVSSISMASLRKILIPIPPLPIQQEIVSILDSFTQLQAELEAELEVRRTQYEYYRNQLLNAKEINGKWLMNGVEVEWKTLGEVCKFVRGPFGGAIKKDCFVPSGYAIYEQQHAIYGNTDIRYFISDEKFKELKRFEVLPGDLIMSCSGTMGKIAIIPVNAPKGVINQALLKLSVKNEIGSKYLKYYFEDTITQQMNDDARGGAIKNVASVDVLKKIKIPIPPIEEQNRIVEVLDKFNTLVNDISVGLPAEIQARRKQYEYYRGKLLDFKSISNG